MIKNLEHRHALQSNEWMFFQEKQGKKVITGSGENWSVSAVLEGSASKLGASSKRLYSPYGPHATNLEELSKAVNFLIDNARSLGASYVRIEPAQFFTPKEMKFLGCLKAHRNFQPAMTHVVDLTKSTEDLLLSMDASVRRLSRQTEQKGFEFKISYNSSDMDEFLNMMKITSERAGATFRESAYLRSIVELLGESKTAGVAYAIHEGKTVSGVLFYDDFEGQTRYYMHAGSFDEARQVRGNPALALYLLLNAKDSGFKRFDFYGVSPVEDTGHPWAGFSSFKRSFGGFDVNFSGTWEIPVKKVQYHALRLVRSIKKH
jgi:lipid II:glycine glycyltransferase (peptidoglycan interpeptide bridge formation enzyme)